MDKIPANDPMEKPCNNPLAGLNPADLLRQGVAEDTLAEDPSPSFTPPPPEELAPLFPQFEILELIGQGGMGAVYKVRQKDLDRIVALKILPPTIGRSPEFSNRFTREAKALARLNHPGIVTIHDFGQADGLYFILMEFVDGVNLAQLMKTGRIAPREALAIVPQICDALQYAHDQGIVHRDIKPENILLDRLGRVKVADFGIAKVVAAVCEDPIRSGDIPVPTDQTLAGKIIGTPQYMAPEQIDHPSDVDHRADIYALGVVFYQMLTGELPAKRLEAPSRKVRIDVRLDEIVLKAMEKDPELRYQQASVMKTRVDELGSGPAVQSLHASVTDAGFWKRFLAVCIDYNLVMIGLFPLLVVLATISPRTAVVRVPLGLFTVERIIENDPLERRNADGSKTVVYHRIVETTVLGKWKYLYHKEIADSKEQEELSSRLIDPVSRNDIHAVTAEDLAVWFLMIYWILMESSRYQASIGKMLVGIKVGDKDGRRISIARAAARNASKIISAITLMIGFMMAGWTRRKQALHDILPDCYVTNSPQRLKTRMESMVAGVSPSSNQMVRLVEVMFQTRFSVPLAIKLINLSALGFFGLLSFLGYVPGWQACFGFAGLYGFFGLLGAAMLVELAHRRATIETPVSTLISHRNLHRMALVVAFGSIIIGIVGGLVQVFAPVEYRMKEGKSHAWITSRKMHDSETETVLANYDWAKLAGEGRISGGVTVTVDGRSALKIENTKDAPLQVRLLTIENPSVEAVRYAVSGEIRYENVQGTAYLEMWNEFPQGRFFSRTLGAPGSGAMSQLAGTSAWREFSLPFDRTGTAGPPKRLELNLFMPGRGTVFVGPLSLTEPGTPRGAAGPKDATDGGNDGLAKPNPNKDAEAHERMAAAQTWLAGIDAGNYEQSWKDAAKFFQTSITEAAWSGALAKARKPLGEMKSRKLLNAESAKSLPGAPDGEYVVMQFDTSFSAKEKAVETVTFMKESDGTWKAAGYFIR